MLYFKSSSEINFLSFSLYVFLTRLHELSESFLHDCSSVVYVLLLGFQGLKFTQYILIGVLQTLARKYHRETYIKPDKSNTDKERKRAKRNGD